MRSKHSFNWTAEALSIVAEMAMDGHPASVIGAKLGVSRRAVIGVIARRIKGVKLGRPSQGARPVPIITAAKIAPKREPRRSMHPKPIAKPASPPILLDGFPVRRFEASETCDYYAVQLFLKERGYGLIHHRAHYVITSPSGARAQKKHWAKVVDFVDAIRVQEGRQPFRARSLPYISMQEAS